MTAARRSPVNGARESRLPRVTRECTLSDLPDCFFVLSDARFNKLLKTGAGGDARLDILEGSAMTHDLQRILESKRALRRMLASRPVSEKLRMLDALRDRLRTIREAAQRRGGRSANKA